MDSAHVPHLYAEASFVLFGVVPLLTRALNLLAVPNAKRSLMLPRRM